ncbi:proteoglycan 4-like [Pieris napi]|uniref:proteoglycan 4-like n=1 Tax=Pieris napi TaxID=78633 RepID=UPI001FB8912B|nr:proteoglycan 4-like [Pieris napi]
MTAKIYVLCLVLATGMAARPRQRLQQQPIDAYEYEPEAHDRAGERVVLVSPDAYDLYQAQDRVDEEYEPRAVHRAPQRLKQNQIQESPKQPPVQTIRNYNKVNDDGSFTFGYEAADGSFKEETRGTDCVVRGKYGYVDPDGNKREFTYVSGNPCDPNKPNEDEEQEGPAAPESAERDDGVPNYPTRPALRPTTARPTTTYFQNDFRDADEEPEEEPLQNLRPRIVQRPQPARPVHRPTYQAQPIAITPRPVPVTTARALPPATTFRPQLVQVTARPQVQYSPEPNYAQSPSPNYAQSPSPNYAQSPSPNYPSHSQAAPPTRPSQIDFAAEFAKFHHENQVQSTTPSALSGPTRTTVAASPSPSNPLYSTELVYDPSSGQYNTQLFQSLPQTKGELNLNQRLQPYVAQQQPQAQRPFIPSPQIPPAAIPNQYRQPTNQETYQRQQSESQFQNSAQLFAQQQQIQQSQLQRDRAAARAQAQRLSIQPQHQAQRAQSPQYYYVPRGGESISSGQIDAFLRGHGIQV